MILSLIAVLCAGAAAFLAVPGDLAGRRLARLTADARAGVAANGAAANTAAVNRAAVNRAAVNRAERRSGRRERRLRLAVSGLAGVACVVVLGSPYGWAAGALAAIVSARSLARLEPRAARTRRARIVAESPVAIDLLAACLRGGGTWHESVDAVARAVGGPLGEELARVAARIRLGADPAGEWLALGREPALASLGRAAARAAAGGAPLAATLTRLARDQRRAARTAASARARSAGVRAVAPLGLCFLPAFVLLGIVPAVAGIAADMLP